MSALNIQNMKINNIRVFRCFYWNWLSARHFVHGHSCKEKTRRGEEERRREEDVGGEGSIKKNSRG